MKQYETPMLKVIEVAREDVVKTSDTKDNDATKPHSGDLFGPVA